MWLLVIVFSPPLKHLYFNYNHTFAVFVVVSVCVFVVVSVCVFVVVSVCVFVVVSVCMSTLW